MSLILPSGLPAAAGGCPQAGFDAGFELVERYHWFAPYQTGRSPE
ncbi:MAG TPA: hypothetical protein VL053_04145 [Arachidicoccus sp.]|nr:hypothetical protein [Arachidicoccus sp.]